MSSRNVLDKLKLNYATLINFIDDEENDEMKASFLFHIFKEQNYTENLDKIKSVLFSLLNIANNHHRSTNFYQKIEKILLIFKHQLQQNFTSQELLDFFKSNKRIILFFIENQIIPTTQIKDYINTNKQYFLPEQNQNSTNIPLDYEKNRKIGENESHICELIRSDSVVDFISHVNTSSLKLKSTVPDSIFETNYFLNTLKRRPTLIES